MTDRERSGRAGRDDWASQVPSHSQRRGPYEDYGWERGESVLPEFRDPSVHEMPYDRQRGARPAGPGGSDRMDRPSGAMDAPGRAMMRNPYDYDNGQRGRFSGGAERRDFDYDRDYDQDRWRQGGQGYGRDYSQGYGRDNNRSYGRDYGQGYNQDYDQDRWRQGGQSYSQDFGERGYDRGFNQGYGQSYGRDYEQERGRQGGQGYGGESYSSQNYGQGYDQNRWRQGGQGYGGGSYSQPTSWSYTEIWLIPGPFTGRGPKGYQRSDDRMREDLCDRLSQHGHLDASDIDVQVKDGEVTLSGTVDSREAKRMAEDVADTVQGVREVHNQLRVKQGQSSVQGGAQSQPGTARAQGHMQSQPDMQSQSGAQSQSGGQQRAVGGSESRDNESR